MMLSLAAASWGSAGFGLKNLEMPFSFLVNVVLAAKEWLRYSWFETPKLSTPDSSVRVESKTTDYGAITRQLNNRS